jgi:Tol biopolymer transport system component
MKTRIYPVILLAAGILVLALPLRAQVSDAGKLYEEGIYQMEAAGNFTGAAEIFSRIANDYPSDKALAAKALIKAGYCYERIGSQKAAEAYNKVINKYSDQVTLVAQARERLAALNGGEPERLASVRQPSPGFWMEDQSLSPDGKWIAGISFENKGQNVMAYNIQTEEVRWLTHYDWSDASFAAYTIVWSPDSREIAFWASGWGKPDYELSQLKIVNLDGESRDLIRKTDEYGIAACAWLPDNSGVVAISGESDGSSTLGLIRFSDSKFHPLCKLQHTLKTKDLNVLSASESADISPDGKWIVFADGSGEDNNDIYLIPTGGGQKVLLDDHPADDQQPRFSPDGKHIVFLSKRHGTLALWSLPVSNGKLADMPVLVLEGMADHHLGGWTQKGLCTRTMAISDQIYSLKIDPASHETQGKPQVLKTEAIGSSAFPLWSPDGKYYTYKARKDDGTYQVIVNTKNGDARKVKLSYESVPINGTIQWMPDDMGLGLVYWDKDLNLYFCEINAESGECRTRKVPTGDFTGKMVHMTWDRDGKSFFYTGHSSDTNGRGLIRHELETGKEHILYEKADTDTIVWAWWNLRMSRDYKRLAFNWHNKIGMLDINSGQIKTIDIPQGIETFLAPTWSPDGKYLLVKGPHQKGEDYNELFVVNIGDGSYKSLDISQYLPKGARIMVSHDWSPDGTTILFDTRSWKSETNVITNLFR